MRLIVENKNNEKLELTNNSNYAITSISGLNPAPANINTSKLATSDGSLLNSTFVKERNIVITIYIMQEIEKNRIALYKFFRPKQYIKLYYSNDSRDVFIEGYVETFEGDFFTKSENFQISIICPFPFFKSTEESVIVLTNISSQFTFPFSIPEEGIIFSEYYSTNSTPIVNAGDVEAGLIIDFYSTGNVVNPIIRNVDTGEFFGLNYTIEAGSIARITTIKGQKSAKLITYGTTTNIINYVMKNSTWLQLNSGENQFAVTTVSGSSFLTTTLYHTDLFEGV